jgi:hypothetical protein|tara:strand:+ start:8282 stop:8725 length:444 start_codon:yes stop_codon:yes gene_type:complete
MVLKFDAQRGNTKLTDFDDNHFEVYGWKGKGSLDIVKCNDGERVLIIEHRKDKHTGEITKTTTEVDLQNVLNLWQILQKNCEVGETYGYRFLIDKLKKFYGFTVDVEAWNGGRNRSKYYFPYHYYPLKVLESEGLIKYFGRGGVMLK